jgi:hypothetical protein
VKTEDLISLLSTGVEAVDARLPARRYLLALAGGTLIALVIALGLFRPNPALWHETSQLMFWVRETYCLVWVSLALLSLFDWPVLGSGSA